MATRSNDKQLAQRLTEAETRRLRAELAAARARESALAGIAQRINEHHPQDIDGNLVVIAEAARSLTGGDGARVFLIEGDELVPTRGAKHRASRLRPSAVDYWGCGPRSAMPESGPSWRRRSAARGARAVRRGQGAARVHPFGRPASAGTGAAVDRHGWRVR
jgi:hypothetical protein